MKHIRMPLAGEQSADNQVVKPRTTDSNMVLSLYNNLMLKRGNDIDEFNDHLLAKLEYEILHQELKGIIKFMVANGMTFTTEDVNGLTSLHYIVAEKNVEFVSFLISIGIDLNVKDKYGKNCSFWALHNGNKPVFELLYTHGFAPIEPRARIFHVFKK